MNEWAFEEKAITKWPWGFNEVLQCSLFRLDAWDAHGWKLIWHPHCQLPHLRVVLFYSSFLKDSEMWWEVCRYDPQLENPTIPLILIVMSLLKTSVFSATLFNRIEGGKAFVWHCDHKCRAFNHKTKTLSVADFLVQPEERHSSAWPNA